MPRDEMLLNGLWNIELLMNPLITTNTVLFLEKVSQCEQNQDLHHNPRVNIISGQDLAPNAEFKELSTPARLILQPWSYVPGFTVLSTCNHAFGTLKPWSFETGVQGEVFGWFRVDMTAVNTSISLCQSWASASVNIACVAISKHN